MHTYYKWNGKDASLALSVVGDAPNKDSRISVKDKDEILRVKSKKVVYLTFDDGPTKWTGAFLDILQEHKVPATFFMQGSNLEKAVFQNDVKRAAEEGHYIGAHSMTHEYDELYKRRQFVPEMLATIDLIYDITGTKSTLVRAPYGSLPGLRNDAILSQIMEAKLRVWDWTIDSRDWDVQTSPEEVLEYIMEDTKNDVEILLLHEKKRTLEILPQIIAYFKEQGYLFGVYSDAKHFPCNFMEDERL